MIWHKIYYTIHLIQTNLFFLQNLQSGNSFFSSNLMNQYQFLYNSLVWLCFYLILFIHLFYISPSPYAIICVSLCFCGYRHPCAHIPACVLNQRTTFQNLFSLILNVGPRYGVQVTRLAPRVITHQLYLTSYVFWLLYKPVLKSLHISLFFLLPPFPVPSHRVLPFIPSQMDLPFIPPHWGYQVSAG